MGFFDGLFGKKESEEIRKLREAAEAGDGKAMFELSEEYFRMNKPVKESGKWLLASAEAGYWKALYDVAYMYANGADGLNIKKDVKKAIEYYKAALEKNENVKGVYNNIGLFYLNGDGVERNFEIALDLFEKGAMRGDECAMYNAGWMYFEGKGVNINYAKALEYYRKAAELGQRDAQNDLGWMYQNGYGVDKDTSIAAMWYRKAAVQGQSNAIVNLRNLGINV